MAFEVFPQKTEAEKFVRMHCLFITTYFLTSSKFIYCKICDGRSSKAFLSSEGITREEAWMAMRFKVMKRLAYLETLAETISEVDNSSLSSKEFLGAMLRKKYKKLGRGMRL